MSTLSVLISPSEIYSIYKLNGNLQIVQMFQNSLVNRLAEVIQEKSNINGA